MFQKIKQKTNSFKAMALAYLLVAATTLAGTAAPLQAADKLDAVLNAVPKDVQIVVVVPDIASLSKKVTAFGKALGLGDLPGLNDPLAMMKAQMQIEKGFNDSGSIVMAVTKLEDSIESGDEPDFVLFMPVSNYSDFVANFKGEQKDGLTHLSMPGNDEGWSKQVGDYCVMGPKKETIAAYKAGNDVKGLLASIGKVGGRTLSASDAAVYINVKALAPAIKGPLADAIDDIEQELGAFDDIEGPEAQMMAVAKSFVTMGIEGFQQLLNDTDGVILGADLDGQGVGVSFAAQFKSGSWMAKTFHGGGAGAPTVMAKLPNEPYLFAAAADFKGVNIKAIADSVLAKLPKDKTGWVGRLIHETMPLMANMKSMSEAFYVPSNPANLFAGFPGLAIVETANADAYITSYKTQLAEMSKIKLDLGLDGQSLTVTSKFTDNALTIDGVSVHQYQMKYNLPPAVLKELGPAGMFAGQLTNSAGYIANVNGNVLMTMTIDAGMMKKGIATIKAGNGLGSNGAMDAVRKKGLPKNLAAEGYVSVSGIMKTAGPVLQMFGGPAIGVPQNLPPIAFGSAVEDGGVVQRVYVPVKLIQWVKDTAMQFMQGAGGGPGGQPSPF